MGMKPFTLLLVIHNHQPVGNPQDVMEGAYLRAYLPFLQMIADSPYVKLSLHLSGVLLDWIEENHPEFFELLRLLVSRGQMELLTGGLYEPILTTIPDRDKIGQIRRMTQKLSRLTGYQARGMWLTERVWEPSLPAPLSEAGVEYTIVDSEHFMKSGYLEEELSGYFVTEDNGKTLKLFPGRNRLRYLIPFKPPEEVIGYLLSQRGPSAAYADDGEKFGVWPGTYNWVYERGWLKRFLSLLWEVRDKIQTATLSEYIDREEPTGRVYLGTCSYPEMVPWSLTPSTAAAFEEAWEKNEELRRFLMGANWRNFLAKYEEANDLHKKMLLVSEKMEALRARGVEIPEEAVIELYKGQCNDGYWHGVFGGLQLPHLRGAVASHLIRAEKIVDELSHPEPSYLDIQLFDLNRDGKEEVVINSELASLYFAPHKGGSLYEFDLKPKSFSLLNVLTRRWEAYHRKVEEGLPAPPGGQAGAVSIHDIPLSTVEVAAALVFDRYRRASFLDHFLTPDATLEDLKNSSYQEAGDFVTSKYELASLSPKERRFTLRREGQRPFPIKIEKEFHIPEGEAGVSAHYRLTHQGGQKGQAIFAVEFNISLEAGYAPDRYYRVPGVPLRERNLASIGELEGIREVELIDEYRRLAVALKLSKPATFWRHPVETASRSEKGIERIFQGSCLLFRFPLALGPGESFELSISLTVREM